MNLGTIVWNGLRGLTSIDTNEQFIKFGQKNYKNDDIVECHYDGKLNQFTLTNATNKALICGFELNPPVKTVKYWYPAISLRDKNDYVEIIQNFKS